MKALSTVYGSYILLLITTIALANILLITGSAVSKISKSLDVKAEKIHEETLPPLLTLEYNDGELYLEIITANPISIRYIMLHYLNGSITIIDAPITVYNYTKIKIGRYKDEPFKIIVVTKNGATIPYTPYKDPKLSPYIEQVYNQTYVDTNVINLLSTLSTNNSNGKIIINPNVGWSFDKSTIVQYNDKLYYLIHYVYSINRSIEYINYDEVDEVGLGNAQFYDSSLGLYVSSISFTPDTDNNVLNIAITYVDGSKRTLSGNNILLNLIAVKELMLSYKDYNISIRYYLVLHRAEYLGDYSYNIYFRWWITSTVYPVSTEAFNTSIFMRVVTHYRATVSYTVYGYPYTLVKYYPTQLIHNVTIASSQIQSSWSEGRVFLQSSKRFDNIKANFYIYKIQHIIVSNPHPPISLTINIPYQSYDLYQINPIVSYPVGEDTLFTRIGNGTVYIEYKNYLLPGTNTYDVKTVLPYLYVINITQNLQSLPSYLILISNGNPLEAVNVSSTNSYLASIGLFKSGDTITFKYKSLVFVDGSIWFSVHDAGSALVLQSNLIIVPVEGPYKGTEYYIWVGDWVIIEK